MSRLPLMDLDEMTAAQRAVYDDVISGPRGAFGGPFPAWLRSPELAARAQQLGAFCRYETSLPPRLSELAILVTAVHWQAQVEWASHARIGAEAGLSAQLIEAIKNRQTPDFTAEDEALTYRLAHTLLTTRRLPDALYDSALALLGERTLVELVAIVGYYSLVALTLNAFEVPLPPGLTQPFPEVG